MTHRNELIDLLRTLSALLLGAYHFLLFTDPGGKLFPGFDAQQGGFRVLVTVLLIFFLLSAIVIPIHLETNRYKLKRYPIFLLKRLTRMYIPFVVVLLLTLFVHWLFCWKNGLPFHPDSPRFFANLTLTAEFAHVPWYNPIFWTLAIELQFYLLIGLIFPLIRRFPVGTTIAFFLIGEMTCYFFPDSRFLWYYTPQLSIGFVIWLWMTGRISSAWLLAATAIIATAVCCINEPVTAVVVVFVPLLFLLVRNPPLSLCRPGVLTYSFYLVHGLVGGHFLYFTRHWNGNTGSSLLRFAAAMGLAYGAAWCFYRIVEKPSMKWAQRIRYPKN